ncbi:hypothetical protein [Xanthomonas oryzae]|uniref:hypothetical protein n=1 Tax=Xanthomonas oryzae TaxID=347 RepID=UPI000949E44E|nr:hypothetical protein [Xanthomonas oryzae]MDI9071543.1 hypothetical protein [Xanthomonas oryzae pv. oryzae]MDI9078849.1 hypothetical protein [Xanthomonas oryzae pv. oryzae]MDI9104827.1 hypothetical protein [Xanthomonas oryzae pv. oryzae]MDI9910326.1 hypothetical protein [Xanthomonas oryzae pv. oryzae]QIE17496.1 hypothetical protein IXO1088_022750 [Xanthomonas oryzae pv. oryzae]
MKINFLLGFVIFICTGCSDFVPFQPNPDEYTMWSSSGASQLDVKKAMLECGYPSPFSINERQLNLFPSNNEVALISRCMEKSGFVYKDKSYNFCRSFRDLPACQPDAPIRRRELSRRLDSSFCKKYTKADACTP